MAVFEKSLDVAGPPENRISANLQLTSSPISNGDTSEKTDSVAVYDNSFPGTSGALPVLHGGNGHQRPWSYNNGRVSLGSGRPPQSNELPHHPALYVSPPPRPIHPFNPYIQTTVYCEYPVPHYRIISSAPNLDLLANIVHQVNYYFSDQNLVGDFHLRQLMDKDGWVSIHEITSFNRIKNMTNDIPLILYAMRMSNVVEVQDHKVRKRNGWKTYLLTETSPGEKEEETTN